MNPLEIIIMFGGVFLALGTFSYAFIGETKWFAISESVFIGGGIAMAGFAIVNTLTSQFTSPIMIIPFIIGILAYTRWTKYRWLARYPIAVLSGIGLGVTVGSTIRGQIIAGMIQVVQDVKTLTPDPISAFISLIGVASVLFYFTYSEKYSGPVHEGRFSTIARIGRIFLFAGFGYLYASTFVAEGVDALSSTIIVIFLRTIRALQGVYG